MGKGLLFIGSAVADVVVRISHLPQTGEDLHVISQQVSLGGCACNAFLSARHSAEHIPCTLFAPVGSGVWGDWVAAELAGQGAVSPIPRVTEPNGCCYCLVENSGERSFLSHHGAEYRFRPEWFDRIDLSSYDAVYLCGLEIEEETGCCILDALEKQPPQKLWFAPGPRFTRIARDRLSRIFALHASLHLNAGEACGFTGEASVEAAAQTLHDLTGSDVVITLGEKGAFVSDGCSGVTVSGIPAVRVADTIGAGDAHIGALMAKEAEGLKLAEAAAFANRVSAAVVTVPGARLPDEMWRLIV